MNVDKKEDRIGGESSANISAYDFMQCAKSIQLHSVDVSPLGSVSYWPFRLDELQNQQ